MPVILILTHISMTLEFQELPQRNWEKDTLIILQYDTATVTDMQITNCRGSLTMVETCFSSFGTNMASPRKLWRIAATPFSQLPSEVGSVGHTELLNEIILSIVDGGWCFLAFF